MLLEMFYLLILVLVMYIDGIKKEGFKKAIGKMNFKKENCNPSELSYLLCKYMSPEVYAQLSISYHKYRNDLLSKT